MHKKLGMKKGRKIKNEGYLAKQLGVNLGDAVDGSRTLDCHVRSHHPRGAGPERSDCAEKRFRPSL